MRLTLAVAIVSVVTFQAGGAWGQNSKDTGGKPDKEPVSEYLGKPVEHWIKEIKSPDSANAEFAVNAILNFTAEKAALALPELMDTLASHKPLNPTPLDSGLRVTITKAVGIILSHAKTPDPKVLERAIGLLQAGLRDRQVAVRSVALESLAALGFKANTATHDFLTLANEKSLGAGSYALRVKAINLLHYLALDPKKGTVKLEVMGELYKLTRDDSCHEVRIAGINAALLLVKANTAYTFGKKTFEKEIKPMTRDADPLVQVKANLAIMEAIGDAPEEYQANIIRLMQHEEVFVRAQAIEGAGLIASKAPAVVPALIKSLKDKDAGVRLQAITSLGVAGKYAKDAVPILIEKLDDAKIQLAVMASLGNIKDKRAVEPLLKHVTDKNPNVAASAIIALGLIGRDASAAVAPILKKVDDENVGIRVAAIQALGRIGAVEAVGPLIKAMDDKNAAVVKYSMVALFQIGPDAKEAVPALAKKLNDADAQIVSIAIGALGGIGPEAKSAVPDLQKVANEISRPQFREQALRAIELITKPGKKATSK